MLHFAPLLRKRLSFIPTIVSYTLLTVLDVLDQLLRGCYRFIQCRLVQENPEVAMDSIVHITQQMTAAKRAQVSKILAAMDSGNAVENSNGDSAS